MPYLIRNKINENLNAPNKMFKQKYSRYEIQDTFGKILQIFFEINSQKKN